MHKVLIVDDEESVRQLLRDCLELDGYEVREAPDALQALDRLGEAVPDCLVLDVMMPGMSGLELLERLRNDPGTALMPILMLTAASDDETTWSGWSNGASCYLPKPFDIDELLTWVGRLCEPTADAVDDEADGTYDLAPTAEVARPVALAGVAAAAPAGWSGAVAELTAVYDYAEANNDWSTTRDGLQVEELLRALNTGQFWVAYQPIVALGSQTVVGVEALARWAHPQRGDLSPSEFLPLAQRHGHAGRLDDLVFLEAVQQVSEWNAVRAGAGLEGLTLSINVSPERLVSAGFCAQLRATLQRYGVSPASVVLELNELALTRLIAGTPQLVRDLLELGVSLAFDDFSAVATSLSFLQRFHVDVVKIDRSLVRNLGLDDNDGADSAVAAIISIAHRLSRAVVAEGVETQEQAAHLRRLGCEYAQGYHFGFPASAAQLGRRLLAGND